VLVDDSGHALIMGFSRVIIEGQDTAENGSEESGLNVQWTAPEILSKGAFSKRGDIFSFAMLMVEVFTCAAPFVGRSYLTVTFDIVKGRRPPRPEHPAVTGRLWRLIQRCWDKDPRLRPEAVEALEELLACNPPAWKQFINQTPLTNECIPLITSIFSNRDEVEAFQYLSGDDARTFVNMVDEALDILNILPREIRTECLRTSYRICGRQALLPERLQVPLCYDPSEPPHCRGGFAEVWKGKNLGQEVAAKVLKVYGTDDFDLVRKSFCREVMVWRALNHPNVLPLLGVTMEKHLFVMVSEWMDNGSIVGFLQKNADADRLELLRDVTKGLIYMHEWGIVHGDLKGTNILIKNDHHACLTDFGLIALASNSLSYIPSRTEGGAPGWMSPELLDPTCFNLDRVNPTRESDYYALGMVIYEVLSGQAPFKKYRHFVVSLKVVEGERPKRPQGDEGRLFTDDIWSLVERCWKHEPGERASAEDVLECLGGTL